MVRLLLIVAAAFALLALFRWVTRQRREPSSTNNSEAKQETVAKPPSLLPCPSCGVHIPSDVWEQHQETHRSI
jgi:hypothetical protein